MIEFLKNFGITEEYLRSKTGKELVSLTFNKMGEVEGNVEAEEEQIYIYNMENQVPELRKFLTNPIEVYVKKVRQKKTLTVVKVIGFNPITGDLVAYHKGKLASIPDDDQIITIQELNDCKRTKTKKEVETV
jgi:hypothetical protein